MSPDEALRRLKQSAFDAAPMASAIFRKQSPEGFVFLGGNSRLEALLHGSVKLVQEPDEAPTPPLIRLVATLLPAPPDDQTLTIHLGGQLAAFRPHVKTFTVPEDPAEYLVVQLAALAEPGSTDHALHSTIRQLKDLLDNSAALMYVKDLDGRYLVANHYYARRLGVTPESMIGLSDYDLFPEAVADNYSSNDDIVIRTASSIEAEELLAKDRDQSELDEDSRWLSIKFPLLDDAGKPYALGAISTDITGRKRAERAAHEAMHEAERANRSKSEFLSRMSHELRTPLNAILGFAQLLQDQPLSPRAAESASHILDAGKHLLALVNDVLDLTWIEAGAPGIASAPVPAIESIHQALELVRPLAAAQDIEIASDLHGALHRYVLADTQRLRQVFINLLGNAVKFNSPQGVVRVWCEGGEASLRFLVMDTGPGMSEEDAERLFKPFVRLDHSTSVEGSGLGLALSRKLVEEMGGVLGIEHTAPGEGSTFYVDMPLAPAPKEDPVASVSKEEAFGATTAGHATILQIEDTYANIRLMENIISGMGGISLISATSGESGVALAQSNGPQLILLDLNLSDMSGVEVVKLLQQDQRTKDIPVIILSADATPARIAELHSMKILDYLTKPFDIEHFARTVRHALALA